MSTQAPKIFFNKPTAMIPYQPLEWPQRVRRNLSDQVTPVPDVRNVEIFLSQFRSLTDKIIVPSAHDRMYNPDKTFDHLSKSVGSYENEPSDSALSQSLKNAVAFALADSWVFDPTPLSLRAAYEAATRDDFSPRFGFSVEEFQWIKTRKLSRVELEVEERERDDNVGKQCLSGENFNDQPELYYKLDKRTLEDELNLFYNPDNHATTSLDNQADQNSSASETANSWLSLPAKRISLPGLQPLKASSCSFNDSGVCMDNSDAEAISSEFPPPTAVNSTLAALIDERAAIAGSSSTIEDMGKHKPLEVNNTSDNRESERKGRKEAPYDLSGLHSSHVRPQNVEILQSSGSNNTIYPELPTSPEVASPDNHSDDLSIDLISDVNFLDACVLPEDAQQTKSSNVEETNSSTPALREDGTSIGAVDSASAQRPSNGNDGASGEVQTALGSPEQAVSLAQDLEHTIDSAVSQATAMTRALTVTPSSTLPPADVATLRCLPTSSENIGHAASFNQSIPRGVQEVSNIRTPQDLRATAGYTPVPRRVSKVKLNDLALPSTSNQNPIYNSNTAQRSKSFNTTPPIRLPSTFTNETRGEHNPVSKITKHTSWQQHPGYNNSGTIKSTTLTVLGPEDEALTPQQVACDLNKRLLSLAAGNDGNNMPPNRTTQELLVSTLDAASSMTRVTRQPQEPTTTELTSTLFPCRPRNTSTPTTATPHRHHPFTPNHPSAQFLPSHTPGTPTPTLRPTVSQPSKQGDSRTPSPQKSPRHLKLAKNVFSSPNLGTRSPSPTKTDQTQFMLETGQETPHQASQEQPWHQMNGNSPGQTIPQHPWDHMALPHLTQPETHPPSPQPTMQTTDTILKEAGMTKVRKASDEQRVQAVVVPAKRAGEARERAGKRKLGRPRKGRG